VDTRRAALEALGKCRDPRTANAIAKHLANGQERGSASKALQFMGPMAESAVIPYLGAKDWGVAAEACQVLRVIGAKDSVVPIVALVKSDRSFLFRSTAQEAADCVIGRADLAPNKDLVPALLNQLDNGPADKRKGVLEALGRSRDPRALEALAKCFANAPDRSNAVKALQYMGPLAESAVLPFLKEKDAGAASEACQVLRIIGSKESIAPLQELLQSDRSFLFRSSAEEALECVKGRAEPRP
jgi:HEAT repeat protein